MTPDQPTAQSLGLPPDALGHPDELGRRFAECVAAGDLDGIVALYAPGAVVSLPEGREAVGSMAIRAAFAAALAAGVDLTVATVRPSLVTGGFACTSTTGATGAIHTQVARQGDDGTWRWVQDGSRLRDIGAAAARPRAA